VPFAPLCILHCQVLISLFSCIAAAGRNTHIHTHTPYSQLTHTIFFLAVVLDIQWERCTSTSH
jgi:hypothetical protein